MRDGACRWSQNRPLLGIVETTQTDGAARRLVGVVACVHISRDRPDQPYCARAGLKPAPTSASSGRGVGGSGLLAGSTVGIGLWWAAGGTEGGRLRLGLFCWCGRGRVLNPPLRLPLRDAVGAVGPPCGFHGGDWLAVGGRWDRRGATSPWAILLVRARAGLKPAPTSASSGRGGGVGPFAGSTMISPCANEVRVGAGFKPARAAASYGTLTG